MIALSFNFIENHLSLSEHWDSANIDLLIVRKIFITFSFSFFISSNWFDNISMKRYDDTYSEDDDNDESWKEDKKNSCISSCSTLMMWGQMTLEIETATLTL